MLRILLATNNRGKLVEIKDLLKDLDIDLVMPSQLGLKLKVKETGQSYTENSALKGQAFAQASGLLTLADDSGLEVEALDGQPGIRSARFAPQPDATDADRRAYLLQQLQAKPQPWRARFYCVAAIVSPDGRIDFTQGECPGEIIPKEQGHFGFGYDPIFFIPSMGKTMAELSMAEKNLISHRAKAVKAITPLLVDRLR